MHSRPFAMYRKFSRMKPDVQIGQDEEDPEDEEDRDPDGRHLEAERDPRARERERLRIPRRAASRAASSTTPATAKRRRDVALPLVGQAPDGHQVGAARDGRGERDPPRPTPGDVEHGAAGEADDAHEPEHRDVGGRDVLLGREDEDRQEEHDERALEMITQEANSRNFAWGLSNCRATEREVVPRAPSPRPWLPCGRSPIRIARRLRPTPTPSSRRRCTTSSTASERVPSACMSSTIWLTASLRLCASFGSFLSNAIAERLVVERVADELDRAAVVDVRLDRLLGADRRVAAHAVAEREVVERVGVRIEGLQVARL